MPNDDNGLTISVEGRPAIKSERISEIVEEVGYWRKANAIHQWFVDNVQNGEDDCREYIVSKEALHKLLTLVNTVIANNGLGEALLPTQQGFFFGSTEYDEYYFEDLTLTRDILSKCLQEIEQNPRSSFFYQSSW